MIFSTGIFIFLFLPITLFTYYVCFKKSRKLQNTFLACVSLFFYAWGEPKFVFVMIFSILLNWGFALIVNKYRSNLTFVKSMIALMLGMNIGLLFVFKYLVFAITQANNIMATSMVVPQILLPIGVSFFTFQAISYVIDVYRGHGSVQKNPLNVILYIAFFPQLIAGPIVRYETIAEQIIHREETLEDFSDGCKRFVIGLGKKLILADNLASLANSSFMLEESSIIFLWVGAIAYTLQIYYDFSGYSDMAIGLGKLFGFHFLENFNYPYVSKSITEFWRRWHISLGSWFRDYVYIPLGGNRVSSRTRMYLNLLIVWGLTGIWHGANWTFLVWGLMYFVLIAFEKRFDMMEKLGMFSHVYTMLFVILGWVIFYSNSISQAVQYIKRMFLFTAEPLINAACLGQLQSKGLFLLIGIIGSMPVVPYMKRMVPEKVYEIVTPVYVAIIFLISLSYVVVGTYSPFIYFNF